MWVSGSPDILIPFLGALMATVTYVVVRAGFIGISDAGLGNPFGFAAIALLVGLFSAQAVQKLKLIFEQVFTNNEPGTRTASRPTGPRRPTALLRRPVTK